MTPLRPANEPTNAAPQERRRTPLGDILSRHVIVLAPASAFLVCIGLTLSAHTHYSSLVASERARDFHGATLALERRVFNEFRIVSDVLNAVEGLFAASERLEPDDFARFVQSLGLKDRRPGIRGLGYVLPNPGPERTLGLLESTNELAEQENGQGSRSASLGKNSLSFFEDAFKQALQKQGPILVSVPEEMRGLLLGADALMIDPVAHSAGNSARTSGFVVALIDTGLLLNEVRANGVEKLRLDVAWIDALRHEIRFSIAGADPLGNAVSLRRDMSIDVYGTPWTFVARARPEAFDGASVRSRSALVEFGGSLSVAMAFLAWLLARALKKAERIAAASADSSSLHRDQLLRVIRTAPANIAMFDTKMRYIECSESWIRSGALPERSLIIGQSHYDVFPNHRHRAPVHERVFAGESFSSDEERTVLENGSVVYYKVRLSPWFDEAGVIGGLFAVTESITDLVEAREKALASARAKSLFLATMSHEIRTPLAGIIGLTELLAASRLDSDQSNYVSLARESGKALLAIVNDILDFSRSESGEMTFEELTFCPDVFFTERLDVVAILARQKGLALNYELRNPLPERVRADSHRLGQVLFNLLGNAIKFTPKGSVTLRVGSREADSDKGTRVTLHVEVVDTGIGIPEEAHANLFQPFFQADGSTSRLFGGTGLGLSICERIITLQGGRIGAKNHEGEGTTFWFELPVRVVPVEPVCDANEPVPSTLSIAKRPLKILVAEDNRVNMLLIGKQLEFLGVQHDVAENGEEVLKRLADTHYDLLLLDCLMPLLDGFETARRIRAAEKAIGAHLPIVALTANVLPEDRARCLEAGMDDHLGKPVNAKAIEAILAKWTAPQVKP